MPFSHPAPLTLGGERFTVHRRGDAVLLFGRGPRLAGDDPTLRAQRVLRALGPLAHALAWCRQEHGVTIRTLAPVPAGVHCLGPGDGVATAAFGAAVAVWTADCLPVLFTSARGVAAVHAGWRGVAAGILERAVEQLGTDVEVLVGPAIGRCHYPVGPEVVDALTVPALTGVDWRHGYLIDLRAVAVARLCAAGVAPGLISRVGGCTACDDGLASYRRDRDAAGRQLSIVVRSTAAWPLS